MSGTYQTGESQRPIVNAGRLWAGGLATALIAALIAVVGVLVARGLFDVSILAPKSAGVWGDASTAWYALGAAMFALVATGVMHLLLLSTPRPMRFFAWIVGLVTVIAMITPFTTSATTMAKLITAAVNLVLGAAIGSLVSGSARAATRLTTAPAPETRYG